MKGKLLCLLLILSSSLSGAIANSLITASKASFTTATRDLALFKIPNPPGPQPCCYPPVDYRTTNSSASEPWQQNEPSVAINPKKPTNMIVGYNDFSCLYSDNCLAPHWSYSTDGGVTWTSGAGLLSSTGLAAVLWSDTSVAFDSSGNAYLVTMTQPGAGSNIVLYVSLPDGSGNAGASWNGPYIVSTSCNGNGCFTDQPKVVVDNTIGSHSGNIYIVWTETFISNGQTYEKIMTRRVTLSGGVPSFSAPVEASNSPSDQFNSLSEIAVAPDGSVYVTYIRLSSVFGGFGTSYTPNAVMISRSDDGAGSFTLKGQVVDSGIAAPTVRNGFNQGYEPSDTNIPTIAVTGDGTVFVAWTGGNDIISRTSSNKGASWNAQVQVDNRGVNDFSDRFLPAAAYMGGVAGRLYVFYYSRQADKNNYYGGPYMVYSTNDGSSFTKSSLFSNTFSNPDTCSTAGWRPCLWGDYMGATAVRSFSGITTTNVLCAVWGDSRDSNSINDNDINVYIRCFSNFQITQPIAWTWRILRPVYYAGPFPVPPGGCPACVREWTAVVLPTNSTQGTMPVNLTPVNVPTGVTVNIKPASAIPPYNATITLNFAGATCSAAPACFDKIGISATDGVNTTGYNMTEVLVSSPFLSTDTNVYNPGGMVNVTGLAFTAGSNATISLDGNRLSTVRVDSTEGFSNIITLPTILPKGIHTLQATDTSGKTASTSFSSPIVQAEGWHLTGALSTLTPITMALVAVTLGTVAAISINRKRGLRFRIKI